ncbi:MAG: thioredoxin family protein [Candidatus Bipolaricaulis sp.]|nr:thioredoxin family protein [Candidatus Bipolaricaulis sp.]
MPTVRGCPNPMRDESALARRRRLVLGVALVLGVCAAGATAALAEDPDVVLFYREGCHDCARMDELLEPLEQEHPNLVVLRLEETANLDLLWRLSAKYGILPTAFPVIFVGDEAIVGVGREKELQLRAAVDNCVTVGCGSPLALLAEPTIPWKLILFATLAAVLLLIVVL